MPKKIDLTAQEEESYAAYEKGLEHASGHGVRVDVDAYARLAELYLKGRGVLKDEGESLRFLAKAASGYHAGSLRALGLRYLAGERVAPDHAREARKAREGGGKVNPDRRGQSKSPTRVSR